VGALAARVPRPLRAGFSGAASAADYETALKQITYNNTDTNPSTETRIIEIVVNDGVQDSDEEETFIQIVLVNNSAPRSRFSICRARD